MLHEVMSESPVLDRQSKARLTLYRWDSSVPIDNLIKVKLFSQSIYRDAGYTDYPFINLDHWSTWFYVEDSEGQILAATRIVQKRPENLIPIELAVIHGESPTQRYAVLDNQSADWNSVSFRPTISGGKAFKICARAVAEHCLHRKYSIVFGMINPAWEGLHNTYLDNGAKESTQFPNMVYYPGCRLRDELAMFRIIELDKKTLQFLAKL